VDVFNSSYSDRLAFFNNWLGVQESFDGLLKYDIDVFKMHSSTFEALQELEKEGIKWNNPLSHQE
jgi:hypothetical protein